MPIECICKSCSNSFFVKPFIIKRGGGKFCCKECQYKWMSENNKGSNNPNYNNRWSEERRKQFSESRKGESNPFYKGIVSEEHKQKMRELRIGKPLSDDIKIKLRNFHIGLRPTEETKYKMRLSHLGERSSLWKGGKSFEPYCQKFNHELRERVRAFWGHRCGNPECNKTQDELGEKLSVHHVHYDKQVCCNDKPVMFIPLCRKCHNRTNNYRDFYMDVYETLINEKYNGKSYYTRDEYIEILKSQLP